MDYDALNDEMNNLLKLMAKEGPASENYETYAKRLGELQQMAIKWGELELAEKKQNADSTSRRAELALQEDELRQRNKISRRETAAGYGKTALGGLFTLGAILLTQTVEMKDIIRTKGWVFVTNLIRRA